jgi:hypothetical protein
MPIRKAKDGYNMESGDSEGRRKRMETIQAGNASDKKPTKGEELERRIIAEECEEEIEGLEIFERMKNDPSWQSVIDCLRSAAIDSYHAEWIVASINRFGRDAIFQGRRMPYPRRRFSKQVSSDWDQNLDDQDDSEQ